MSGRASFGPVSAAEPMDQRGNKGWRCVDHALPMSGDHSPYGFPPSAPSHFAVVYSGYLLPALALYLGTFYL